MLIVWLLALPLTIVTIEAQTFLQWSTVKQDIRQRFPAVPQLSTVELVAWLADSTRTPPLLLDTRSVDEYAVSHLYHAHRATSLKEALILLDSLATDQSLVLYCSVGYRSSALVKKLNTHTTKIYNLEGSFFEWANSGYPIYKGPVRVNTVHPYNNKWGQLLTPTLRAKIDH